MAGRVDDYIEGFEGEKKEWPTTMVRFMRDNYPELQETIFYQIPAFRFDGQYIAFSVAKEHFTYHTLDFEMIEELKARLPGAKFGRGSAKISYTDREAIPVLFDVSRKIVQRWRASRPKE
jgi:uncharacterized protein YdhG (YjbR/CyaY superfamily)